MLLNRERYDLADSFSALLNRDPIKQKFKSQIKRSLYGFMRTVPVPIVTLDPYSPKHSTDFSYNLLVLGFYQFKEPFYKAFKSVNHRVNQIRHLQFRPTGYSKRVRNKYMPSILEAIRTKKTRGRNIDTFLLELQLGRENPSTHSPQ